MWGIIVQNDWSVIGSLSGGPQGSAAVTESAVGIINECAALIEVAF